MNTQATPSSRSSVCSYSAIESLEPRRLMTSPIVVNTVSDAPNQPNNVVTLRAAIARAEVRNSSATITFDPAVFASKRTIVLANGPLNFKNHSWAIAINGPAAGVTVSGNGKSRVFVIAPQATAKLTNMSVTGGKDGGLESGAAIYNSGHLVFTNGTVSGNTLSSIFVGAVFNDSSGNAVFNSAVITDNTSVHNSSLNAGFFNYGTAVLTGCTISANSGVGFENVNKSANDGTPKTATARLINTTVSGNGVGIQNYSSTTEMTNVTISGNHSGGYVSDYYSSEFPAPITSIGNSIVDGNAGGDFASETDVNSFGNNLIGVTSVDGWNSADRLGINAKLGPLASNGGPTQTLIPLAGSPAINGGNNLLVSRYVTTDGRGLPRIVSGTVDIGAVEFQQSGSTTIKGMVFFDPNANGKLDPGEKQLAGWKVYDDRQNLGRYVAGDPSAFTAADGTYTLVVTGVYTGSATIRQVVPAGWSQSTPGNNAGFSVPLLSTTKNTNVNFGDYTFNSYLRTVATSSGLVAWWTFDGAAGADSIVNGYTGTLKGGAAVTPGGAAPIAGLIGNKGLSLSGAGAFLNTNLAAQQTFTTTHYTTVGGRPTFYTTAAATFNVWINFGSAIHPGHIYSILAKSQVGNDLDLQFETDGKFHFYTDNGSSASFAPASLTGWHMLTAEFDTAAKTRSIFWDGKLAVGDTAYTGSHAPSVNAFSIGASDVFAGRYDAGSVDDVSLWNRSLTASEVSGIYAASKG